MKKIKPLLTLILLTLTGCGLSNQYVSKYTLTGSTVKIYSTGLIVRMPADLPKGSYILETTNGKEISTGEYTGRKQGNIGPTGLLKLNFDHTTQNSEIASECMRIRTPENSFLPVQTYPGYTAIFGAKEFKLPVFELETLKNKTIPAIKKELGQIKGTEKLYNENQQWLENHPSVYINNQCIFSEPAITPPNTCSSRQEARIIHGEYCRQSNITCSSPSTIAKLYKLLDDTKQDYDERIEKLAFFIQENLCAIAIDKNFNQETDLFILARGFIVGELIEKSYKSLINNNPSLSTQVALDAFTALTNYELCINDKFSECTRNRQNWLNPYEKEYNQCRFHKKNADQFNYQLTKNPERRANLERDLEKSKRHLDHLQKNNSKRGYWQLPHKC